MKFLKIGDQEWGEKPIRKRQTPKQNENQSRIQDKKNWNEDIERKKHFEIQGETAKNRTVVAEYHLPFNNQAGKNNTIRIV